MKHYYDYCQSLLARMIACETVNPDGHEEALAALLRDEMRLFGMNAFIQEVAPGRANVIAQAGESDAALLLNGHMDVVPALGIWTSDPFVMTARDGKLYGRGTADMKGPIAAMITAVKWHMDQGHALPGRVKLVFVADEEVGTTGVQRFLRDDQDRYIGAVIGEPTGMEIAVTHKGLIRMRVNLFGKSAHASRPNAGVNSIEKVADAILCLRKLNEELGKKPHPLLPRRTLTPTMINGGEKENIIPSACSFLLDIRHYPGDTYADMEAMVAGALDKLKANDPDFCYSLTQVIDVHPGELPADHPFTQLVLASHEQCFGQAAKARDFSATCEQCFLLAAGIPTLIAGPGHIAQAHVVDEYIALDQLEAGVRFYKQLIFDAFKP